MPFIVALLSRIFGKVQVKRHAHNIKSAMDALKANKLKSMLTALGIIFGVAAVISMLAIGWGAKHEILEQIKFIGVNNIIISSDNPKALIKDNTENNRIISKGLSITDIISISKILPNIRRISPEIIFNTFINFENNREPVKLIGIYNSYFNIYDIKIESGNNFNYQHEHNGMPVCILSSDLKKKLFNKINPIGQNVKCGKVWLKIIGIYDKQNNGLSPMNNLKVNFDDNNIYVPALTMLLRFTNRSLILPFNFKGYWQNNSKEFKPNRQQLDKIILQVNETEQMVPTAEILNRMLLRRHFNIKDFEITIPELLLKQQQHTKDIFNIVLGAIAAISLIVGGIGIMNITYASVLERTKEIGMRMAVGATRIDIGVQFIVESIFISIAGGIIGVLLGIVISKAITLLTGIVTIVSLFSIIVAFVVSVTVGISFGYAPAREAALKNPIESLRYE